MQIDEQLNLIVPVDRANGTTVWIHAAPIGREVFQKYWLVLSKAFAGLYGEGLGSIAGPRIAALMLRQRAEGMELGNGLNEWNKPGGVEQGLMPEIRRLANVAAMGNGNGSGKGWNIYPLDHAIQHNMIDIEDVDEIEGVLVFFTLVWRLHRTADRQEILAGGVKLWGASTSSLSLSAFVASLPISIEIANTGEKPPAPSSPPPSIGLQAPGLSPASPRPPMSSPGAPRMNIVSGT